MDAIGLMVTQVDQGFLRITEIGGLDDRVLPGQQVIVHGKEDIHGVIVQPPSFLLPEDEGKGVVGQEYLFVDTGLLPDELDEKVRIGDLVSFAQKPLDLGKNILAGHSLDNRASVAVLTECLHALKKRSHEWDVWLAATVQEEETMGGALTSAYQIRPDIAIAIDVTWAKGPGGGEDHKTFGMGEGFTLSWGPSMHPGLFKAIQNIADRYELPYSKEVLPRYSGTDADAMQIVREGIPTMVVSIPIRYMHTPVEMISLKDIHRVSRLLVEFIASLDADFMDSIKPED
jgi:endoglucanase